MLVVTTAMQAQAKSTSGALQLSHVPFEQSEACLKESSTSSKPLPSLTGSLSLSLSNSNDKPSLSLSPPPRHRRLLSTPALPPPVMLPGLVFSSFKAKAKGSAVERAEVYQRVYHTKNGVPISTHAEENMNRMTELLNDLSIRLQGEIGKGILWSNDDAYARVMSRPERPGRVRWVGFGITPSRRNATNLLQFALTPLSSRTTLRISELETSYEQLREQVAQFEARHREELAQSEARHQQQMADVMTSVRDMISQISQGARDVSTQGGSA
ncbi:hypothetical protein SO802_016890 [Lithocarpus litseifolius]|uniref:Uncharacterized protein n=1 Tax=Lithocarpus litseifolius TaxID=425828 RepID=A0AAW2CZ70_9ROSI